MFGFDLETTGIDVEQDRILTSSIVWAPAGEKPKTAKLIANPGIEIPEESSKIHGITNEYVAEHGRDPIAVIERTHSLLGKAIGDGSPIVGMNLPYDFTLLDREARRHGLTPLIEIHGEICPIIDVFVIDKHFDERRRGSRKLEAMCKTYGVVHEGAHDSTFDVLASMRIFWKQLGRYPRLRAMSLPELHAAQIEWKREQQISFATYRLNKGNPLDDVDGSWPIRPFPPVEWQPWIDAKAAIERKAAERAAKTASRPTSTGKRVSAEDRRLDEQAAYDRMVEARLQRAPSCRDPWCLEGDPDLTCGRSPEMHLVTNPHIADELEGERAAQLRELVTSTLTEFPELVAERHAIALLAETFGAVPIVTIEKG